MNTKSNKFKKDVRYITVTAIMSAIACVLMILEFSVPLVPSFLKFDFSDLPAFITSFAFGPLWGVAVQLIKNVLHLLFTHTGGVGELANFIVGSALILPAGFIYKYKKGVGGAVIGALCGTLFATVISLPVNYFITYPFYSQLLPMDQIIKMYQAIIPAADTLPKALVFINCPFTLVKGLVNTLLTFLVYKRLSPILKGKL